MPKFAITFRYCLAIPLILGIGCTAAPSKPRISAAQGADYEGGDEDGIIGPNGMIKATGKVAIALAAQGAGSSFPRLSHAQWENSVKDLLFMTAIPGDSKNFPDDPGGSAFGNNGALFSVTADQWTAYRNAAESVADRITKDAAAVKKITGDKTDAKSIVSSFLRRAYRRPPTGSEISQIVGIFNNGSKLTGKTDATTAGVYAMIDTVLQSPNFLYRIELGSDEKGDYVTLTPYEVAARLSYQIWNTLPDDALSKLADDGTIMNADVLREQADRLLSDARGQAFMRDIHVEGYGVDQFQVVPQDTKTFPETARFDTESLRNESVLFFNDVIVSQGKGITELLTAPYAYVSAKTAQAYGVSTMASEPQKTELDPMQRAGFLTQVAFLSNYSKKDGATAIVKRGHYVAETVLCGTFQGAPPPPDITGKQATFKTNREFTASLTEVPGCAGCHASKINPPGYALERFGAGGKWRSAELNGNPIDAKSTYAFSNDDTITFDGPTAMIQEIVKRPELHQCYAKKLVEALYGRYTDTGDAKLIEALGIASEQGLSAKDLLVAIASHSLMTLRSDK